MLTHIFQDERTEFLGKEEAHRLAEEARQEAIMNENHSEDVDRELTEESRAYRN